MIHFGPSGNSDLFYKSGNKHSFEAPKWINSLGLNAFEYSFGHGVRIGPETAEKIKQEAEKYQIQMSVHAPYYISLSSDEEDTIAKNLSYLDQCAFAAGMLGAKRVVFHPGSALKLSREKAFFNVINNLQAIFNILTEKGYTDILFCPETMGKINQIGDLSEIAGLCGLDERIYPAVDFAHLHARTLGGLKQKKDFAAVIEHLKNTVGWEKTKSMHVHFSKVEFTKAGEKMHKNFADEGYGPDFEPLAEIFSDLKMTPTVICESRGTQDIDAKQMMEIYHEKRK